LVKLALGLRIHIKSVPIYVQHIKYSEILHYNSSLPKANNCTIYPKKFSSPFITPHCIKFLLHYYKKKHAPECTCPWHPFIHQESRKKVIQLNLKSHGWWFYKH